MTRSYFPGNMVGNLSLSEMLDKDVVHLYKGMLVIKKNEILHCDNRDGPTGYYAQWNQLTAYSGPALVLSDKNNKISKRRPLLSRESQSTGRVWLVSRRLSQNSERYRLVETSSNNVLPPLKLSYLLAPQASFQDICSCLFCKQIVLTLCQAVG